MANAFTELATQDAALQAEVMARYQTGGMAVVAELTAGRRYAFSPADAAAAG